MKTRVHVPAPQMHCTIKNIAIFGSADVDENHPLYKDVYNVSRYLAYHNYTIVNGGGPGVMDAATQGAEPAKPATAAQTAKWIVALVRGITSGTAKSSAHAAAWAKACPACPRSALPA